MARVGSKSVLRICETCDKPITEGQRYRRIRKKDPKPRSRQHAFAILNSGPHYSFRHMDCLAPETRVDCPKCFANVGRACFHIHSVTGKERVLKKSHQQRITRFKKEFQ